MLRRRMSRRVALPFACALLLGLGIAPADGSEPRYDDYQKLLDRFLITVSRPGEPLETRVDYLRLDKDAGGQVLLGRARYTLASADPDSLTPAGQTAWAINLYNLRVIDLVLLNLMDPRTHLMIHTVKETDPNLRDFFEQTGLVVAGQDYTLDSFEKKFLFHDFDRSSGGPRPEALDPRVHFALVCAALGCPPLSPLVYRGDSLDVQLDRAVRESLRNPRHLRWDAKSGQLLGSQVFFWYQRDFEPEGAYAFVRRYGPAAVVRSAERAHVKRLSAGLHWDWGINRFVRKTSARSR